MKNQKTGDNPCNNHDNKILILKHAHLNMQKINDYLNMQNQEFS